MNDRQRKFAECYAGCGNATTAAIEAGYSPHSARQQGQRLLSNASVLEYLRTLQEDQQTERIATLADVKAYWSRVMRDPSQRTGDRLKASELLARSAGVFARSASDPEENYYNTDAPDEDVLIVLPDNGRDRSLFKVIDSEEILKHG